MHLEAEADSRGEGKGGVSVPCFGLHLTLRSTDDKLNGIPLSGYRTKKAAAFWTEYDATNAQYFYFPSLQVKVVLELALSVTLATLAQTVKSPSLS